MCPYIFNKEYTDAIGNKQDKVKHLEEFFLITPKNKTKNSKIF